MPASSEGATGTVLVSGASGYAGDRLVPLLEQRGERVRCLARRPELLAGASPRALSWLRATPTFAAAARAASVPRIVYLGGLVTAGTDLPVSARRRGRPLRNHALGGRPLGLRRRAPPLVRPTAGSPC